MARDQKSINPFARLRRRMAAMKALSHSVRLLILLTLLLTAGSSLASQSVVTGTMSGHWEGSARIVVSWCHHTNLPVKVDIHPDGTVAGTIGDATLVQGRFQRNRGWLGRKLNLASDYIIQGDLQGALVAAEGITRSRVMIPLNFTGSLFKGGVNTSGSMFCCKASRKEKMVLSAMALTLTRSP